jgi:hypothetical protein
VPPNFLAPLLGTVAIIDPEPNSSVYHPIYLMDSDPTLFEISKGNHLKPPPLSHPIKTSNYELHPALIAFVRENSFAGTKEESPYIHL